MPELPEVETVVRDLRPHLVGRRIVAVRTGRQRLRRRWSERWLPRFLNRRIEQIQRRGKWIAVAFEGETFLVIHLGMTGQLTVVPSDRPQEAHTHFVFELGEVGRQLRFRDIRRFGSVTLFADRAKLEEFFAGRRLGPEPFDVDPKYWRARLADTRRCLKAVLLDQRVLAGVGNIYADEALFEARLHPSYQGHELTPRQAGRLRKAVASVLHRAIDKRGSTIQNYIGGSGLKGNFQHEFRVYGRTGEHCLRCRGTIECIRLAGRSTHFCPRCQKKVVSG